MNEATVLQKAATWARWIRDGNRVVLRDEARVREALRLLADKGDTKPYPVARARPTPLVVKSSQSFWL